MLELFARLRGMKPQQIAEEVNYWLTEVGITEYADRKCGTYSGGNKRKLNVAQVHSVWILQYLFHRKIRWIKQMQRKKLSDHNFVKIIKLMH